MDQEIYRKFISGDNCGLPPTAASLTRAALKAAAWVYGRAVSARNCLYSRRLLKIFRSPAPVISIGNITAGGTGKTPMVIWICNKITSKHLTCAVLTRGYKSGSCGGDEPALISKNCGEVNVVVNPDRIAGARKAVETLEADVLVMDDGFQHRRLHRDLDIITIDATAPFGCGALLPAGLLREPLSQISRADAAVITRTDQASAADIELIRQQLTAVSPDMPVVTAVHSPVQVNILKKEPVKLNELAGKRVFLFCGIGNPEAFFRTMRNLGCIITGTMIFNDHCRYTKDDIAGIYEKAAEADTLKSDRTELIVTTHKDWTKSCLMQPMGTDIPLGYLDIKMEITGGEEILNDLIEEAVKDRIKAK